MSATISQPKKIEDISIYDLRRHRWCYFQEDEGGFDSFEWVIPDTHLRFDARILELELATFRFYGGEEFLGMLDGCQFSVCLGGEWHSFWTGVAKPSEQMKANLTKALGRLGLALPVEAKAKWSGKLERYNGIRYIDEQGNEADY